MADTPKMSGFDKSSQSLVNRRPTAQVNKVFRRVYPFSARMCGHSFHYLLRNTFQDLTPPAVFVCELIRMKTVRNIRNKTDVKQLF